jgi:hypothetical protein
MGGDSPRLEVERIRCTFCGKRKDQVALMVAGPGVDICDECVDLANQIVTEKLPSWPWDRAQEWAPPEPEQAVRPDHLIAREMAAANTVLTIPAEEEELRRLWNDFKDFPRSGDPSALIALIEHYQPLADHYVDALVIDREVFELQAHEALIEALLTFDQQQPEPFEAFALREIQNSIYQAIIDSLALTKWPP